LVRRLRQIERMFERFEHGVSREKQQKR